MRTAKVKITNHQHPSFNDIHIVGTDYALKKLALNLGSGYDDSVNDVLSILAKKIKTENDRTDFHIDMEKIKEMTKMNAH